MNLITPIILILISLSVFFGYIDPMYRGAEAPSLGADTERRSIQTLQALHDEYQEVLLNSQDVSAKQGDHAKVYNSLTEDFKNRLVTLLPDNVNNINLIIEVDEMAKKNLIVIRNVKVSSVTEGKDSKSAAAKAQKYGAVELSFSTNTTYDRFMNLLRDLESNLRLMDITDVSVTGNDTGFYDFNVTLRTYWLKI